MAAAFSILGDSISTYWGFSPDEGVFYDPSYKNSTGIASVADTWWWQVMEALGGTLLANSSYAGSGVCRYSYQGAASPYRVKWLQKEGQRPDVILIYSGLNDVATYVSPEEFGDHYAQMLHNLKEAYPKAAIWCGTLCQGFLKNPNWPAFLNFRSYRPLEEYNAVIRAAVVAADCHLADLAAFDEEYSSLDGVHPNGEGMAELARRWLSFMAKA